MPWFRFLKKDKRDQAAAAVVEVEPPVEEPEQTEELTESTDPTEAPRRRRRRGSRGGRSRRKTEPGTETSGELGSGAGPPVDAGRTDAKAEKVEKAERSQRRTRSSQQRRRPQPRRAPLPEAKRELLISVDVGEQRVAVIEDGKVAEVYLERPERRSIAGNIYLGVVDNVLPGMEAAFVEVGLEKNGFLYVDEIVVPELEGKRHGKKITDLIQRGQVVLVQAVKDPMKTKGARLTTEISLPGRFLVYVPQGEGLGVSRRLEESERNRLKEILKRLDVKEGGVIVRTAAEGASAEDVERDFVFLQRLWKTIQAREATAKAPELVYQEAELPLRIVRDLFAAGFEAAHVDNDRAHRRIVGYLKKTSPDMLERVHRYKEKEPLFERFGVEKEIASTLERRVDLPSGGYLIFDYAEAFTVIDVNTGRFVGSRSKSSTQRLEDTIVKNNLEAVKEVVRQLRLRDIGGIIVIDFIDMANPKNRQAVEEALRQELERDRTKTYVVEISPLGLVEMTRQNVTDGPREVMTRKCQTCGGDGIVVSDATSTVRVERSLRALAAGGARGVQAFKVAVHPRILPLLAGPGGARLLSLEEVTRRRFFVVEAEGHVHTDSLQVLAEGKTADLEPTSPLAVGAELDVKLVEVGRHDATAAVGSLDGVAVTVAGAASRVGRKARVRIGLVLDGQAFATLVDEPAGSPPITFESAAEKPTRAPAKRKAIEPSETETGEAIEAEAAEEAEVGEKVEDEEPLEEGEAFAADERPEPGEGAAPKKRTRRGSRGGRRRKKPAAAVESQEAGASVEAESSVTEEPEGDASAAEVLEQAAVPPATAGRARRAPKIHVPGDRAPVAAPATEPPESEQPGGEATEAVGEPGTDGDQANGPTPRKRTRRGSRGGRNKRSRPAVAVGAGELDEAELDEAELADSDSPVAVAVAVADGEPPATEASAAPPPEVPETGLNALQDAAGEPGEAEAATAGDYVPMSEWIGDFDRPR